MSSSELAFHGMDLPKTFTDAPCPNLMGKDNVFVTSIETASVSSEDLIPNKDTTSANLQTSPERTIMDEEPIDSAPQVHNTQAESEAVTAQDVLHIIASYGVNFERTGSCEDFTGFMPVVTQQISNKEPVRLLLLGFPFKSPNPKKVLGALPDLGEELALGHLDGLCRNIAEIYEHGAEVHIFSDGLVYNDLLGVSNEAAWDYGEAVRYIAQKNALHHLKFIRLWNLLEYPGPWTKESYLAHASCIRRELLCRYRDSAFEADIANMSDNLFSEDSESTLSDVAKIMMCRWKAFSAALEANLQDHVRLSIHDSIGRRKLSMSLLPQPRGKIGLTPWHSTIAVELDGTYRTVHASDVQDSYDLVYVDGRPSHYRAKSDIFDWKDDGHDVVIQHLYPTGICIRPLCFTSKNTAPSIRTLPMQKVRKLAQTFSPVVLRGFSESKDKDLFISKGHELGELITWIFGQVLKVKDAGETAKDANNVTSNEAMPMHYDGVFRFVDETNAETGELMKVVKPPGYQFFTCISAAPKGTGEGYTLFANSRLFFRNLPAPWTLENLEKMTWDMVNDGYWSAKQTGLPLVVPHKETGAPCIRFHEPWTDTKFSRFYVTIENDDQSFVDVFRKLIYDHRVCLRFEWEEGDLLVSDNFSMMHTRSAYTSDCDRELWRLHFD